MFDLLLLLVLPPLTATWKVADSATVAATCGPALGQKRHITQEKSLILLEKLYHMRNFLFIMWVTRNAQYLLQPLVMLGCTMLLLVLVQKAPEIGGFPLKVWPCEGALLVTSDPFH
jgi:hypothetical protein